jgi:hypothetical protein
MDVDSAIFRRRYGHPQLEVTHASHRNVPHLHAGLLHTGTLDHCRWGGLHSFLRSGELGMVALIFYERCACLGLGESSLALHSKKSLARNRKGRFRYPQFLFSPITWCQRHGALLADWEREGVYEPSQIS